MTQVSFRRLLRRLAMEFSTIEELQMFLDDHPNADRSKHKVVQNHDDPRITKEQNAIEDKILELHEFADLDPENVNMRHVNRAVSAVAKFTNMSNDDVKKMSKGDISAVVMARGWFEKGLKNKDLDPDIRKKVQSSVLPQILKFLQRAKNLHKK